MLKKINEYMAAGCSFFKVSSTQQIRKERVATHELNHLK